MHDPKAGFVKPYFIVRRQGTQALKSRQIALGMSRFPVFPVSSVVSGFDRDPCTERD